MRAPDGYTALRRWRVRALVRTDLVAALTPWLLARRLVVPQGSQAVQGGRGASSVTRSVRTRARTCHRRSAV